MPNSICVDGAVLDFRYEKNKVKFVYNFYIGDIFIGQVFKMPRNRWSAVAFEVGKGFKRRSGTVRLNPKTNTPSGRKLDGLRPPKDYSNEKYKM